MRMAVPPRPLVLPDHRVPRLSREQMAHLKREGYLVLPAALDPELLRRTRDRIWDLLGQELPRMQRDDPSSWGPIQPGENTGASEVPWLDESQPHDDSVNLFAGSGHRFYLHCAEERLFRDAFPLALHDVAEQVSLITSHFASPLPQLLAIHLKSDRGVINCSCSAREP
jgi:hypothetical protein